MDRQRVVKMNSSVDSVSPGFFWDVISKMFTPSLVTLGGPAAAFWVFYGDCLP